MLDDPTMPADTPPPRDPDVPAWWPGNGRIMLGLLAILLLGLGYFFYRVYEARCVIPPPAIPSGMAPHHPSS